MRRGSLLRERQQAAPIVSNFSSQRVLVEGAELAFFSVDAPAPPHDAQTGHHRDGEIDAEHAGDFAARENAEQSRQRVQFHTDSHDAGRDHVIQYHPPGKQKQQQRRPSADIPTERRRPSLPCLPAAVRPWGRTPARRRRCRASARMELASHPKMRCRPAATAPPGSTGRE